MKLRETIENIKDELDRNSLNKQRKRYLINYLSDLEEYLGNHPETDKLPTHLELFCDLNPDASECRIYNV